MEVLALRFFGCTEEEACNYDPDALFSDGSCVARQTNAVCVTEAASQKAPATALARHLLVVTIAMETASLTKTTMASATVRMSVFPPPPLKCSQTRYKLTVEAYNVGALGTTYRFYVNAEDETDWLSAVFGNDQANLFINTPENIYNDAFNSSWNASGINPALLPVFPDLAFDSFATIGLDGPASGVPGAEDPSLVQDAKMSPSV